MLDKIKRIAAKTAIQAASRSLDLPSIVKLNPDQLDTLYDNLAELYIKYPANTTSLLKTASTLVSTPEGQKIMQQFTKR